MRNVSRSEYCNVMVTFFSLHTRTAHITPARCTHLTMSSSHRLIYGAFRRLQGRFHGVESVACLPRPPAAIPGLRTSSTCTLTTTVQWADDDIQPLSVDDYHALIETGRLDNSRVELLYGQLVRMAPHSFEHTTATWILNDRYSKKLDNRAVVRDSKPITLRHVHSEPEPDLVIASGVPSDYWFRNPAPDDILLVAEVSKSTLRRDSTKKLELYASQNIREYWIIDLDGRNVRVLQHSKGNSYLYDETFHSDEIAPAAFPDVVIQVKDLFPPEAN